MRTVWSGLKAKYAMAGECGLVETKWYDKKWFITTRKILFPIDLAVHIAVGTFTAPFKFIKSFFMGFRTAARITKDLYSDKPNEHCYSNGDCCIINSIKSISAGKDKTELTIRKLAHSEQMKIKTKWESSIAYSTYVSKPPQNEDKSIKGHIQVLMGLRSMKPIKEYDQHPHPGNVHYEEKGSKIIDAR